MFSIAPWLDSVKDRAGIESDYRLAKTIRKSQSLLTNYRAGRSLPDSACIVALCDICGDDPGPIAAAIEAQRAPEGPARALWQSIAERLRAGSSVILSAGIAVAVVPQSPIDSMAYNVQAAETCKVDMLYIVLSRQNVSSQNARIVGEPCMSFSPTVNFSDRQEITIPAMGRFL